jgi:hypothetical protein
MVVKHSAGYFSNMTIRLYELLDFMRTHGRYPDYIDSSEQFGFYKNDQSQDISKLYIKPAHGNIEFNIPKLDIDFMAFQFNDYRNLDFAGLNPIIKKYFSLGYLVEWKLNELKHKYKLDKYISVFYRGNDKQLEVDNPSYELFIQKAKEVQGDLPILILPDECKFYKAFTKELKNVILMDETPCADLPNSNLIFELPLSQRVEYGAIYNAAVYLLSQGEHLITHSGNGGVWATLYRGHSNKVHQIYKDKIYV